MRQEQGRTVCRRNALLTIRTNREKFGCRPHFVILRINSVVAISRTAESSVVLSIQPPSHVQAASLPLSLNSALIGPSGEAFSFPIIIPYLETVLTIIQLIMQESKGVWTLGLASNPRFISAHRAAHALESSRRARTTSNTGGRQSLEQTG